jgi:mannose-6-phosphate isomerase-like protein (cupin superfamily)
MPSTNKDIAETQDFGVAVDRTDHLDDTTVNFVSIRETHSLKDALAGLPNGQCHCPHWGYVLSGRMTVDYGDCEETYGAGDAFYMTPGHVPSAEAGTELVQFSPKDQLRATMEAIHAAMSADVS